MKRQLFTAFILLIILVSGICQARAQTKGGKTVEVKIYLLDMFEQDAVLDAEDLTSVVRRVDSKNLLRGALEELLKGATEEEENTYKLFSPAEGFKLISVRQINKTAYLGFARETTAKTTALNRRSAFIFKTAVVKTALQFRNIRWVQICVDGISDFDRFGRNIQHKKCLQ